MRYFAGSIILMLGLMVIFIGTPFIVIGDLSRTAARKLSELAEEFVNGGEKGGQK